VTDTNSPPPRLLTIDELAQTLGTSVRHVRRLVAERRIPYVKVGWFIRFDGEEVARWIDEHRVDGTRSA
jgi:excisionase family DNA binding protein